MREHKRTEEQQKDYIFDFFSKCRDEPVSDRKQVYFPELCIQIYKWYKDYLSIDVDKMGLEIAKVIDHFIKDEILSKIPNDKDGFFKYLVSSIKREKAGYYREYNENETIKIPKEKKQKLREVKDFIRMNESQLGRKLTVDECTKNISNFFKQQEYVDLLNVINVGSISYTSNDGNNEIDALNYATTLSDDPVDEYISKYELETTQKAIMSVLAKKQERARDCYKALFTLHCIKNDLRGLYPVLDQEIIDAFHKNDKKPKQYEIYLKYHPEDNKNSAETSASNLLREFKNDLNAFLAEKKH